MGCVLVPLGARTCQKFYGRSPGAAVTPGLPEIQHVLSRESSQENQAETVAQPEISKDDEKKFERHGLGRCTPCVFFASNRGCADSACGFCHLAHQRGRPPKRLRHAFKAEVEMALHEASVSSVSSCAVLFQDLPMPEIPSHPKPHAFSLQANVDV